MNWGWFITAPDNSNPARGQKILGKTQKWAKRPDSIKRTDKGAKRPRCLYGPVRCVVTRRTICYFSLCLNWVKCAFIVKFGGLVLFLQLCLHRSYRCCRNSWTSCRQTSKISCCSMLMTRMFVLMICEGNMRDYV